MPEDHRGEERPTTKTLCTTLKTEANLKCLILTGLIYGCVVAIIWCRITRVTKVDIDFNSFPISSTRQISPCDDGYIYIPTAFVIMLYMLYLVECWHCKARIQLSFEKTDVNTVYRKVEQMRAAQPMVWWKAVCYHYIRRTKQVTRYRNGDALPYTSTKVYYERVNSHAAAGCFFYALCGMKDISKELLDLEKHAATKIRFSKGFLFANLATSNEFQEQRDNFFKEQERFDDYMEMREGLDLSNVYFKENMVAWNTPDKLPWFAKTPVFWLCSFLLLSWPLRIILELNTAHVHYQVNKLFGVNYTFPYEEPSFHQNSRVRNHGGGYRNRRFSLDRVRGSRASGLAPPTTTSSNRSTLQLSGDMDPLLTGGGDDDEDSEDKGRKKKWANKGCQQLYTGNGAGRLPRSVTLLMTKPERFEFFDRLSSEGGGRPPSNHHPRHRLCFQQDDEDNSLNVHFNNYFYSYYSNSRTSLPFRGGDEGSSHFSSNCLAPSYSEALLLMEPNTTTTTTISSSDTESNRNRNNNNNTTTTAPPELHDPAHHYQQRRNSIHIADDRDISYYSPQPHHHHHHQEPLPSVQSHLIHVDSDDRNRPRNTHTLYSTTNTSTVATNTDNGADTLPRAGRNGRRASTMENNGDCVNFNNFSSSRRHFQRRSSSSRSLSITNSSTVLDTLAPRGLTGVQIDLTQPVVISAPRDTLVARNTTTSSESPPTYEEALMTSRPVFLPALARLRRCLTERNIARGFTTTMWLNNVNPTFLNRLNVSPPGTANYGGGMFNATSHSSNSAGNACKRSDV